MNAARRRRLEGAGWKIGGVREFLDLTPEEAVIVEMKLLLSASLKRHRQRKGLSQVALAKRIHSSQSRVAKLEAGEPGFSLDLLFRALFATGVTPKQIARDLAHVRRSAA